MHDCLIVGGGIIGLSLAYELARHGAGVRVIDRGQPGEEASWAGAGILPPANLATAMHPWEQLCGLSHQLHPQWAAALRDETGIDTGYRRCGGIYLARSAGEAAALAALARSLSELGVEMQQVANERVGEIEPALAHLVRAGQLRAAYLLPDEAQLRNPHHLRALVTACRQRGVEVTGDVEAREFEMAGTRLRCVHTSAGRLEADRFCITAGAWTYALLRKLHIETGILPVRGQMVLFRCPQPPLQRIVNEGPRYLVPRDDGRVLVGSTEEEVGFDKRTTDEGLGELTRLAQQLVPQLDQAAIEKSWAGLRPGSFDGFPYLGAVPGLTNAFVAAGHFRSGLHTSTGTAVVIGQLIRGESPQIDLSPFRVGRG